MCRFLSHTRVSLWIERDNVNDHRAATSDSPFQNARISPLRVHRIVIPTDVHRIAILAVPSAIETDIFEAFSSKHSLHPMTGRSVPSGFLGVPLPLHTQSRRETANHRHYTATQVRSLDDSHRRASRFDMSHRPLGSLEYPESRLNQSQRVGLVVHRSRILAF